MFRRFGNVLLWAASSLVALALLGFLLAPDTQEARAWLLVAAIISGLTWCARYVFAGRKGI